jgi:hypothetical protein
LSKLATIPKEVQADLDEAVALEKQLVADCLAVDCSDTVYHNDALHHAVAERNRIKQKLDYLTAPLVEAIERLRALFTPALKTYAKVEEISRAKLSEHATNTARLAAEARRKAQEEAAAGRVALAVQTLQAAPAPVAKVEGLSYRTAWEVAAVDLAKVPEKFLQLDMTAVRKHIQGHKGDTPPVIPGVAFQLVKTPIRR